MSFQQKVYIDTALPFGMRSAPNFFNAVADALLWILKHHGASALLHYLDDFITFGPPNCSQCATNCRIIFGMCELLGVPLASDKCQGPCSFKRQTVPLSSHPAQPGFSLRSGLVELLPPPLEWYNANVHSRH